jgi:hypothetical protein
MAAIDQGIGMNKAPWQAGGDFLAATQETAAEIERFAYLIGQTGFLAPVGEAIELIDMQPIYWVPNLPAHVRGVTSVHGFLIPALDLDVLFGRTTAKAAKWLLVFGQDQSSVALAIHSLPVRRRFRCADQMGTDGCPASLAPHMLGSYPDAPPDAAPDADDAEAPRGSSVDSPKFWLDFDHKSYFANGAFR